MSSRWQGDGSTSIASQLAVNAAAVGRKYVSAQEGTLKPRRASPTVKIEILLTPHHGSVGTSVDQICLVQLHRDVAVLPLSCSCVLLVLGLEHGDEAVQHNVIKKRAAIWVRIAVLGSENGVPFRAQRNAAYSLVPRE